MADDAPRPLAPVSLGDVTQRRPTLRWALPPGIDGAVVELCRDRACTSVIETLRVTGTSARPTADLPARSTVFWRMRGRAGGVERTGTSPTWIFHVPAMSASTAVDTSFNPHFDINGDGFDDVIVGAREARPGVAGRVATASVFYGSATWTQPAGGTLHIPDRLLEGAAAGDWFGVVVATADDVDREGFDGLARWRLASPGARLLAHRTRAASHRAPHVVPDRADRCVRPRTGALGVARRATARSGRRWRRRRSTPRGRSPAGRRPAPSTRPRRPAGRRRRRRRPARRPPPPPRRTGRRGPR